MKKNPVLVALGKNVRELREQEKLTQEALAERSGLDPSYISGIERGQKSPALKAICKKATALGIKSADLIACKKRIGKSPKFEKIQNEL